MVQPTPPIIQLSHRRHKPLSHEKEAELVEAMRRGGPGAEKARAALINANLKFVIAVARNFAGKGLPIEDLISEGALGLVRAADKFEPSRGRFISYAVWWIRQAMVAAMYKIGPVTLPSPTYLKVRQKNADAKRAKGKEDDAERIEEEIAAVNIARNEVSTESMMENGWEPAVSEEGAEARLDAQEQKQAVARLLACLSPNAQRIIRETFGLDSREPSTLEEVGYGLGVSRERIRQLKKKAMERMIREAGRIRARQKETDLC